MTTPITLGSQFLPLVRAAETVFEHLFFVIVSMHPYAGFPFIKLRTAFVLEQRSVMSADAALKFLIVIAGAQLKRSIKSQLFLERNKRSWPQQTWDRNYFDCIQPN